MSGWRQGEEEYLFFLAHLFIHLEFCIMSITNPKIDFKEHGIEYEVMRKNKVGLYVLI